MFVNHQGKKAKRTGLGPEGRKAAMLLAEELPARIALNDFGIKTEQRATLRRFADGWIEPYVEYTLRRTYASRLLMQGEAPDAGPGLCERTTGPQLDHGRGGVYGDWIRSPTKPAVDRLDDTLHSAASISKSDVGNEPIGLRLIKGGG